MWTQDSSCDFLNWSKQQQKSWADSKGLQHPDAGPCLSLSVWERETCSQEHRPATQWKQRAGEKTIHRMRQSAELRKKQNKTEQCWQPGHSPTFDCVKNRRRGVKAELTLEPLESAWRLSHAKQGSSALPMCGLRRVSRCQGCIENEPLGWLLDVSVSFTCMHMIRICTKTIVMLSWCKCLVTTSTDMWMCGSNFTCWSFCKYNQTSGHWKSSWVK